MGGIEVCQRLRSSQTNLGTLVALLTADPTAGGLELAQRAGADVFFSKPFSPSQVRQFVIALQESDGESARAESPTTS